MAGGSQHQFSSICGTPTRPRRLAIPGRSMGRPPQSTCPAPTSPDGDGPPPYKREILDSRVKPTRALATLLAGLRPKPAVLVCASAIGIYGSCGDELLTEASLPGNGFLPQVCLAWEKATQPATDAGIRVVHLRFGVVLSPHGGALAKMLPVFRAGLGGQLGSGRQWISWVVLPDVVRAIEFALQTAGLSGRLMWSRPTR